MERITLRIVVIGSVSVGKSSIIKRYTTKRFEVGSIKPTIGVDFATKIIESNNVIINLQLYDTAGMERYSNQLGHQFYRQADGILLIYDLSRSPKESFDQLKHWFDEILIKTSIIDNAMTTSDTENVKIPIVVVGNKQDLKSDENNNDEIIDFCDNKGLGHLESSAKDSFESVEAALLAITSLALTEYRQKKESHAISSPIQLRDMYKKQEKKKMFCMNCSS